MQPPTNPPPYPKVDSQPNFPAIERRVLEQWRANDTFRRSVELRPSSAAGGHEFIFYDGPPFANGLPHFGHLLTGYAKDVVPRFQTMRGRRVERRFGWDCHGLPAEMEAERELGISGRAKILEFGIERFNSHCRQSVLKYTREWREYVTRQGRWVDFDDDYKTMDRSYMESVLWAFKQLWQKGLIYEGYRVLPYSWAAETPVSNFETRIDNSYRERDDPAVTVRFELRPESSADLPGPNLPTDLLIWTTTPWTLPSNLAAAVGPAIEYRVLELDGRRLILGAALVAKYARELGQATDHGALLGSQLVGRHYRPPFDYFLGHAKAHRVLAGEFVATEEGTGIVHMAPGFGEDDQQLCEANGIALVVPVDERGRFTSEIRDYVGQNVFEANPKIIKDLKARGLVLRHEQYRHNYPHCWRTDQPLIYRAMTSWYVEVTKLRGRMVELNQQINWIPEHVRDGQFGKWLAGARDWSISRNRFWGTPIPVWKSDDPRYPRIDVYGSIAELERDFGVKLEDLHRPTIDALVRPNPDDPTGKSRMRRVEDVLDCWFESGSMPFAQVHYPFEKKEWFERHFPADFIVEYVAQTRGWFYTLMVLGTALFDRPPFKNVICHGVVVAADGQKLSKRLKNYPPPEEVFERYGSDAMRWQLMSAPIMRGGELAISKEGSEFGEVVRLVLNPIWNAWSFYALYANADGLRGRLIQRGGGSFERYGVLDRYALAKTAELVNTVTARLESYEIAEACNAVRVYLDALNNWYIRRSRPRFWSKEQGPEKQAAYDTLYTCLHTLLRVVAPLLPFLAEHVYTEMTGEPSVHLSAWPAAGDLAADPALVADIDRVRAACSAGLGLREEARLRVRLPLAEAVIAGQGAGRLQPYLDLLRDELNVKSASLAEDVGRFARFELKLDARKLGPRVGGDMKAILAAAKAGQWERLADGDVLVAGHRLLHNAGEFNLALVPAAGSGFLVAGLPSNDAVVVLDARLTPELEREGLARDLVRMLQQARKDAGLEVSDRIRATVVAAPAVREALAAHRSFIAEQVLATSLLDDAHASHGSQAVGDLAGAPVYLSLSRA
jgi:isoleucyl-tRNA synthetase